MVRVRTDDASRRSVLKTFAASGATALGGTGVGVAVIEPTNELHLVEVGVTFQPSDGVLAVGLRMPVDSPPKYRTSEAGLVPTEHADEVERRLLRAAATVVSNGSVRPVEETFGGPTTESHLPLELWNGRQPVDAARVAGTVEVPRYSVHTDGTDVVVTTDGPSATVPSGDTEVLTFPPVTYSIAKFVRVDAGDTATAEGEGAEPRYRYEERTHDRTFVPTLHVRDRGTVTVVNGGGDG